MKVNVTKRNGKEVEYNPNKILIALQKANKEVLGKNKLSEEEMKQIKDQVETRIIGLGRTIHVEEIQDMVEEAIMEIGAYALAKKYITYRFQRTMVRQVNTTDEQILSLLDLDNEEIKQENSNKNPTINSVQRDYMAGEVSKDLTKRFFLPPEIVKAHEDGVLHFHDMDYFSQKMHNCCLVNLNDMLQNGTVISETMIEKPHSFATACTITTQVFAQVASSQFGGQSITLSHLAPFIDVSRKKLVKAVTEERKNLGESLDKDIIRQIAEIRLKDEIKRGVQTIQYQTITLMTTNGQAPFITIFMYLNEVPEGQLRDDLAMLIEEVLKQRIVGTKNEKGIYITPAFPKLIYVLSENNIYPNSKYYDLTLLAAKCTAKRMVPDYISEKVMKELKDDNVYPSMGCRSFLTVDRTTENLGKAKDYVESQPKFYGRFNQGVVTLNLVDVACSSEKDKEKFWKILDERLELCYQALMCRHKRLEGTLSDVAPIMWQHGALARLEKGETIDKLLHGGYSTISLGYAGLYECTMYMTGHSHTDKNAKPFALKVMQYLNDACTKWKEKENVDFSLYGTPLESTTYRFAKCLQRRFGKIPNVTDKNYITNSYHVHVTEKINAFDKLSFESEFQALSPGGAISYVEVPDLQHNIDAVMAIMMHIYEHIMYAELNTKSDYCHVCGFDGQIQIVEKNKKLVWECPNCGNHDQDKMNVARRTCGYIGTQFWNQGRTQEIKDRVLHL